MPTPTLAFHHLQDLAVREGSRNPVVRAIRAGQSYEEILIQMGEAAPYLPSTDAELAEVRRLIADALVALAQLDQALGTNAEGLLLERFEHPAELAGRAA